MHCKLKVNIVTCVQIIVYSGVDLCLTQWARGGAKQRYHTGVTEKWKVTSDNPVVMKEGTSLAPQVLKGGLPLGNVRKVRQVEQRWIFSVTRFDWVDTLLDSKDSSNFWWYPQGLFEVGVNCIGRLNGYRVLMRMSSCSCHEKISESFRMRETWKGQVDPSWYTSIRYYIFRKLSFI